MNLQHTEANIKKVEKKLAEVKEKGGIAIENYAPSVLSNFKEGDISLTYSGAFELREGDVKKEGENKGKKWASLTAIFTSDFGPVNVAVSTSELKQMSAGDEYTVVVYKNKEGYMNARLKEI